MDELIAAVTAEIRDWCIYDLDSPSAMFVVDAEAVVRRVTIEVITELVKDKLRDDYT